MKNILAALSLLAVFFVPVVSIKAVPQSQSNNAHLAGTLSDLDIENLAQYITTLD